MISDKSRLYNLLEVIKEKMVTTPKDKSISIDPKIDLKGKYPEEEIDDLLQKLQEEKVLLVVQWSANADRGYVRTEEDLCYKVSVKHPVFESYFENMAKELQISRPKDAIPVGNNKNKKSIIFEITYTDNNEILLNRYFELRKPNFDSNNDRVFELLYKNPNKRFTKAEVERETELSLSDDFFHDFVERLGFKGDLRKVFFNVTKDAICFKNPITQADLSKLDMERIRLFTKNK